MTRALRLAAALAAALALAPGPGAAQTATGAEAEIVFWTAVVQDNVASSYQAYLEAYPNGRFAALARTRLARLAGVPSPAPAPQAPAAAPAPNAPATAPNGPAAAPAAAAWVKAAKHEIRSVDGVGVDMDASGLRKGSNWRLAVVPASWPDGQPPDMAAFLENSIAVDATRQHVTVPAGPPGQDELRLYWIPIVSDTYVVAARTPVTVRPGVAGAVLMRKLAREAARLGPVRFEAAHRDKPMLIEAAFLRLRPEAEWDVAWFRGFAVQVARPTVVINVGQVGAVPDENQSLGEGVCLLDVSGPALDVVAAMRLGDPVVLRAVPSSWSSAGAESPVLLRGCEIVD